MKNKKTENRKKQRKIAHLNRIPHKYYIFSEGTKTEPSYFTGFAKAIKTDAYYKNIVHIEPIGVGMDTIRIINYAEKYAAENLLTSAQIWCVYDKDNFPDEDFNAAPTKVKNLNSNTYNAKNKIKYSVAWSNQCIEYWFILHFVYYPSDNDREKYKQYLHKKFFDLGFEKYEKNDERLFDILTEHGNPKLAVKYAKKDLMNAVI
jgi:hypothetical protein